MSDTVQEFDFSVNLLKAILWEYNDAANLQSLLTQKAAWYTTNQTEFWENWITNVFDLRTANDFGLSVWSIILGAPINMVSRPSNRTSWGFGSKRGNFAHYNFANPNGIIRQMPTEMARIYLQLRYFQLTSSGTVPETNRMLKYVFGGMGSCWLQDKGNMEQRYVFNFPLSRELTFLFDNFDILPRPAGVGTTYIDLTRRIWGFGPFRKNFNNGNFGA
jgi:hypothetical protein